MISINNTIVFAFVALGIIVIWFSVGKRSYYKLNKFLLNKIRKKDDVNT